jgi:hypothetical protein
MGYCCILVDLKGSLLMLDGSPVMKTKNMLLMLLSFLNPEGLKASIALKLVL